MPKRPKPAKSTKITHITFHVKITHITFHVKITQHNKTVAKRNRNCKQSQQTCSEV